MGAVVDLGQMRSPATKAAACELSIVIPTFNEVGNVRLLVDRIAAALPENGWEIVFVDDDSSDGTRDVLRGMARNDNRIRVIERLGRRGLSSACIEGVLSTTSPYVAIMDADLQHDERRLADMLATLRAGDHDVVVGSRYVPGGSIGSWDATRAWVSRVTGALGRRILKVELADPMSGFFAMRRDFFDGAVRRLSPDGFKILLDLFASSPRPVRFVEVPYEFRNRLSGESKLDARVGLDFLRLLLAKSVGRFIPVEFIMFAAIGGTGLLVHLLVLGIHMEWLQAEFSSSQLAATIIAMVFNFTLNNEITYRDRRLRGRRFVWGLASFMAICSVGMAMNLFIATTLFSAHAKWILAGVAGAVAGAVWNYALSSAFTWKAAR
jgi:dolichol-phosphate mannosyltransferase